MYMSVNTYAFKFALYTYVCVEIYLYILMCLEVYEFLYEISLEWCFLTAWLELYRQFKV